MSTDRALWEHPRGAARGWGGRRGRAVWRQVVFGGFRRTVGFPRLREKGGRGQGPPLLKPGCGRDETQENLLPRELLLPSGAVSKTPSSHGRSGQLFTPHAGGRGRGRGRAGSLLTGSWRERPFRSGDHVLFFP